mgnify:FL=1|jgi:hypothetical protein
MMMPANFSAVAENEMTYVVGGSLVDVLAPAMTTANWQNVSANVIKIVGNSFLKTHGMNVLNVLFDGNYVPGDVIGYGVNTIGNAYKTGASTFENGAWGFAVGALNAGMQILGGLSAIYTLGSSSIGLEFKGDTSAKFVPYAKTV